MRSRPAGKTGQRARWDCCSGRSARRSRGAADQDPLRAGGAYRATNPTRRALAALAPQAPFEVPAVRARIIPIDWNACPHSVDRRLVIGRTRRYQSKAPSCWCQRRNGWPAELLAGRDLLSGHGLPRALAWPTRAIARWPRLSVRSNRAAPPPLPRSFVAERRRWLGPPRDPHRRWFATRSPGPGLNSVRPGGRRDRFVSATIGRMSMPRAMCRSPSRSPRGVDHGGRRLRRDRLERESSTPPSSRPSVATIKNAKVGWEAYGELNEAQGQRVLITHLFSGTSHVAGRSPRTRGAPRPWPGSRRRP